MPQNTPVFVAKSDVSCLESQRLPPQNQSGFATGVPPSTHLAWELWGAHPRSCQTDSCPAAAPQLHLRFHPNRFWIIFPCPGSPRAPGLLNNYLVLREQPEVFTDNSSCADRRPALGPERVFWPPGRAAGAPQIPEIPAALPRGMIYLDELSPPQASGWGFGCVDRATPQLWMLSPAESVLPCNKNASRGLFAVGCSIPPVYEGQSPAWSRDCAQIPVPVSPGIGVGEARGQPGGFQPRWGPGTALQGKGCSPGAPF